MEAYWICVLLFRIFLPCIILVAATIRPTATSYVYLLMGLWLPFFSVPTSASMASGSSYYLKVLIIGCLFICVNMFSFFFALIFPEGKEYYIQPCGSIDRMLRTAGIVDVRDLPLRDLLIWCVPEPLMLLTSVGMFVIMKRLTKYELLDDEEEAGEGFMFEEMYRQKVIIMLRNLGKYLVLGMFCLTAVIRPSAVGFFYYLIFLFFLTCWCGNKSLEKNYARGLICIIPIIAAHLSILLLYQMQYFIDNTSIKPKTLYARMFQLQRLHTYRNCKDPRLFRFYPWSTAHVLPYMLYLLYYGSVLVARQILEAKDGIILTIAAAFRRKPDGYVSAEWRLAVAMERYAYENVTDQEDHLADKIKRIMDHGIVVLVRLSYLFANFIMMIWAISYINWKTLILLIWANVIWLLPGRKKIMLVFSPLLVVWVWFLLVTSYLYSLNVKIPRQVGFVHLAAGIENRELQWSHLLIKSIFSIFIFIPMRQFLQELALEKEQKSSTDEDQILKVEKEKSKTWIKLKFIINKWFILCWIWVVVITMLWMDFTATSNPFRISFIGLGVILIISFQLCPFKCWKKFLRIYWWIIIIYAMLNLFLVYLHQMKFARDLLHTYVLSEEGFRELGFYATSSTRNRLLFLSPPLFFQIAVVLQLHYLQDSFDKLTSPFTAEELVQQQEELENIDSGWQKIVTELTNIKDLLFNVMEIHLTKMMLLCGWLLCVYDCCAVFIPFVICLTASCLLGRTFSLITINLMSVFTQILIVLRLVYMNKNTHWKWDYTGFYERNGEVYNVTLNFADWLGFHTSRYGRLYADFWPLLWSFVFVFVVTIHRVVTLRQINYRLSRNLSTARHRVLFPRINHHNCHDTTKDMAKFIVNYGFYKFGIEITYVVCTIVLMIRMDVVAIALAILLLLTFSLGEKGKERILIPIIILVGVWLPLQYLMSLGYWPEYWDHAGTRYWNKFDIRVRIQQFCYFMNMAHPPNVERIISDFFLLLCFSRQLRTFQVMRKYKGKEFGAGRNDDVGHLIDEEVENPVPDFVTYTRNVMDVYKKVFFFSWFYISLLAVFLAGTMRPAIYSFGYILASFFLMWEGREMFLRPPRMILKRWNLLIFYNVSIMIFRTVSQIVGCIMIYEWQEINCILISIFDVNCIDRFEMTKNIPGLDRKHLCELQNDDVGLEWDCICFFCLIVQQRIFKSYHFFHIVNNAKSEKILSDQGAKLIEDQRQRHRQAVDYQEDYIRTNIRKRVERYRAKRLAIYGSAYLQRHRNDKKRLQSADYYLYDDIDRDFDLPILPFHESSDTEYEPHEAMNFQEYMTLLVQTSIPNVLYERALRKHYKQLLIEGNTVEQINRAILARNDTNSHPIQKSKYEATTLVRKVMNYIFFVFGLIESILVSLTALVSRGSKNFRLVVNEMYKYRKILKENTTYTRGIRVGYKQVWKPNRSYHELLRSIKEEKLKDSKIHYSTGARLLRSIWFLVLSQSEWLCYLMIILNQLGRAKFISLPLPLMVFCWSTLTVPRPTKTFWVIIIAYSLIMSLLGNFFAMELLDWNENAFPDNPFFPPSVIGIGRDFNPFANLLLLSVLIFHRVVLQWQGLWEPRVYHKATLLKDGDYGFVNGTFVPKSVDPTAKVTLNVKSTRLVRGRGNYIINGARKYAEGFRVFLQNLIAPSSTQIPVDVYTAMFVCDIISFVLIVFSYGYFTDTDTTEMGVIQYLKYNRVPVTYICSIIAYFIIIVMDRWIYRRRNRYAKLVLHLFQVLSIHIWAFVLYPMITGRVFVNTPVVQIFYMLKCCYFLFSAYQIRNGYPQLISGHCLKHNTGVYNSAGYKLFKMVPYLSEMRSILDWTCTDTSLGVKAWFKMEKISTHFFTLKCLQDQAEGTNSGEPKPPSHTLKYIIGSFLFTILFLTLIFPFMLFSLRHSVGVRTSPAHMTLEIYLGTTEPIFHSYASERTVIRFSKADYVNLTNTFYNTKGSETLFGSFNEEDVIAVKWSTHSLSSWVISPGSLADVIEEVKEYKPFSFHILIRYTHVGIAEEKTERVFGETAFIPPLPSEVRQALLDMLTNDTNKVVWLPLVFPKFLMITNEGKPKILPMMERPDDESYHGTFDKSLEAENAIDDDDDDEVRTPERLRHMLLALRRVNNQMWWQVREECNPADDNYRNYLHGLVHNSCRHLVMYIFNEKVFPGTMHYFTGGGIVGLYLLYFMMVFGILTKCFIGISDIWVIDLPNVNRIFRKCKEVYVARDMKNLELEKDLYAELIFIMRSTELCIKLTRYDDDPYNPNLTHPGSTSNRPAPPPPPPPPAPPAAQQGLIQPGQVPPAPAIGRGRGAAPRTPRRS